ncbi:Uncharacterized protein FWK35_00024830 [Aphis craccivora]|uniref:Uncharacterized protein n=1 Tax=Aphis craccivora TaxID=307492 RepID=A0A6G0XZ73_APHCR|nr:Uncharacterized protein FWK35_00024830 [Aphis craccivora]
MSSSSSSCSFFDDVPAPRCRSPQLFSETYNPADYTLRVAEYGGPDTGYSLGFNAGQRFPWTSPDSRPSFSCGQHLPWMSSDPNQTPIQNMLSGRLWVDEILNDAQSFHLSDYEWGDDERVYRKVHWKKKMISNFRYLMFWRDLNSRSPPYDDDAFTD